MEKPPKKWLPLLQKAIHTEVKKILFLTGIISLLTTTGCLVAESGGTDTGDMEGIRQS
jgi:hypothetical protein